MAIFFASKGNRFKKNFEVNITTDNEETYCEIINVVRQWNSLEDVQKSLHQRKDKEK